LPVIPSRIKGATTAREIMENIYANML